MEHESLRATRQLVLLALAVQVGVLALTGLWLAFNYRPQYASAWSGVSAVRHGGMGVVRLLHRTVAGLTGLTALVAAGLMVADVVARGVRRRRLLQLAAGPALLMAVLAAGFTGYLLPWDQLALWAVSVGSNMKGYTPVFGSNVRFVLIGGVEVSKATMWRWFVVHTVVLGVGVILLVGTALRAGRASPHGTERGGRWVAWFS